MQRHAKVLLAFLLCLLATPLVTRGEPAPAGPTPEEGLKNLLEGNGRYVAGRALHPHQDSDRRVETVKGGQHPFAVVLTCSDSRVPVEEIFDQGVGDLFVVRVAGNVSDTDEIGTAEYGAEHLGAPLLVVMGHSGCGAVTAVVKGSEVHGSIPGLVDNIIPAAEQAKARSGLTGDALVAEAIRLNVWQSIRDLLTHSEMLRERVKAGKLQVVGAVYDLTSGNLQWMGEHPEQSKLLTQPADAPAAKPEHKAELLHPTPVVTEAPKPAAVSHPVVKKEEESGLGFWAWAAIVVVIAGGAFFRLPPVGGPSHQS